MLAVSIDNLWNVNDSEFSDYEWISLFYVSFQFIAMVVEVFEERAALHISWALAAAHSLNYTLTVENTFISNTKYISFALFH